MIIIVFIYYNNSNKLKFHYFALSFGHFIFNILYFYNREKKHIIKAVKELNSNELLIVKDIYPEFYEKFKI